MHGCWVIGLLLSLLVACSVQAQDCAEAPLLLKAQAAFAKTHYAKAERLLDKLLAASPDCAAALHWKGRCLEAFEDYGTAYEAYSGAIQLAPNEAAYSMARGDLLRTLGTLRLQSPTTCGECGKQYLPDIGDSAPPAAYWAKAVLDYQLAIRTDQHSAEAHYALALTYQALGRMEQACLYMKYAQDNQHPDAAVYLQRHCTDSP